MINSIFKLFQKKKIGKRVLAGALALMLTSTTILGDINIAYALTDVNAASAEEIAEIVEALVDEITEESNLDADNSEMEISADEEALEEIPSDEVFDAMPPISVVKTVDDYDISLECGEGTFAEGTTVEIKKVDDETKEETDKLVEDAIEENAITEDIDIVKIVTFDISFFDKDGNVVEPAGRNSVSVNIVPSGQDKKELEKADALDDQKLLCSVFHIEDDENVEEIECESSDPVEEVTFAAESFSAYSIVWYKNSSIDELKEGPDMIGGYIKTTHTFADFKLPLEFLNEGSPADPSLRPEELEFNIYGKDATGAEGVSHDEVLICKVTVPIGYYYDSSKTVTLKKSDMSETEIPLYVEYGTQELGRGGLATYVMTGFEYRVELRIPGSSSIYTVIQGSTGLNISADINDAEWKAVGNQTLSAERQTLNPQKFYVSWIDNRNKAGKRPYSTVDDFVDDDAKREFMNSITLYRKVGDELIEKVTDSMLPTTLEAAGPNVGKKEKSISDWEITYNNLPVMSSDGEPIKYYITVNDESFASCYSAVMPEESITFTEESKEKMAFLSGTTAKYIYSENFNAKVEWYDGNNNHNVRLTSENLAKKFVITDDEGNKIYDGSAASNKYEVNWTKTSDTEIEWEFNVGPLPMYDEQGNERSYNLVLKEGVIKVTDTDDHHYEYSVDYSNVPKTTAHENCLSDGKIILVIDRDLDDFKITKTWADNNDYAAREEAVKSGVRFLLWRYPEKKIDGTDGTPADRAAVFNAGTHLQYSYSISMDAVEGDHIKDSIDITLREFGVTEDYPVDMYDQYGHKYIYFATEVINKSGYKTVYSNVSPYEEYNEYGVMNKGTMTNVRQEKMKMEGIVKWNVPSVNDYTNTTVTIELQKYNETSGTWETLSGDGYTKKLSGFTVTKPKQAHIFPEVDRYDEHGKEIKYRIIQTNVHYLGDDIPVGEYSAIDFEHEIFESEDPFEMNTKEYTAHVAPTPETADSFTIENRLAGDMELKLSKLWVDNESGNGFGKDDCTPYQNIVIKVFQHGVSSNYDVPYMTIETTGSGVSFGRHGGQGISEDTVPYTITYRDPDPLKPVSGVIHVTEKYSDGRAKKWEFKDEDGNYITLPAFNDKGNAYSYTVEELNVTDAYTTYSYERKGNELAANVSNKYVTGGGGRTVIFQKEWIDGTDILQEKPLRIALVRIKEDGSFYHTADGKIDLKDKLGKTHIVTLTDNNNWYNQLGIDVDSSFDSIGSGDAKRYLYTAIELDMALYSSSDFSREVKYDEASIKANIYSDINSPVPCFDISGEINAYLDSSHEENHLPGYDVTVKAESTSSTTEAVSVIDASKYIVVNKRKGIVNVVFDKKWQDGSNSEETRNGTYRVYLYQNGKKVVASAADDDDKVAKIPGIINPAEVVYTKDFHEDTHEFRFEGLPQYDEDGNVYHYSVKEFLVKDDKELEIALTDTKDSTKTGYVVSDYSEKTYFSISNNTILERNDTYKYTNTITGEKTGGAKFYVLWHDHTSYDKGNRPDVNYVLYYKTKDSDKEPQVYNGEYKVEWHPMYDDGNESDPSKASRYYQYINFTKLPLANDEGVPYEYYAVPSLNNPGDHYYEAYYKSKDAVIEAKDKNGNIIRTSANKYHYDMGPSAEPLPTGSKMLPENGIVEYTIYEFIHVEGNKIWRLADNGEVDLSKLPDAKIYLWRENAHDNTNANPSGTSIATTELNDDKTGYAFMDGDSYKPFEKYDKYGLSYTYSVSEKIYVNSEDAKYKYSIPNYVMNYKPETNGITNVYNPKDGAGIKNLRRFTVTKDWAGLTGDLAKKPVAEFRLYRIEVPLKDAYYTEEGPEAEKQLSPNPTADAYKYAFDEFKNYKKTGKTTAIEVIGTKSVVYSSTVGTAVWDDMPIFSPNGLVYLYFVEELNKQGIESFNYDVIKEGADTRPDVIDIDPVNAGNDRSNILISDDTSNNKVRAVLFSNFGLVPSQGKDYKPEETAVYVNHQEAGYKNEFKDTKFGKIVGYKTWEDGIFSEIVRPKISDDNKCPEVILKLTRSAATQTGHNNSVASEVIDSSLYNIEWHQETESNKWRFELTPKNLDEEFKLYATNGRPYTYTVTESVSGNTLANYTIVNGKVSGSEGNVKDGVMTLSPTSSLQNKLKGQIKLFKKWDDALNELKLRAGYVEAILQYRLVPISWAVGMYEGTDGISKWENYGSSVYTLNIVNKWAETVSTMPVIAKIDGIDYRYEYRLLETEFYDLDSKLNPVDIKNLGSVPNGGLCTDGSSEGDRNTKYGNSTSPDPYKNRCYEVKIGNYIVNNSAISSLPKNSSTVSSMELRVDNRLAKTTSLKIEKKWDGVSGSEATVTPEDKYGILPDSLTFYIEYKRADEDDDAWVPLREGGATGKQVSVKINKKEDNSYVFTVSNLPQDSGTQALVYRAIEQPENLERYEPNPVHVHDRAEIDGDRIICHTTVTNKLEYRNITIKKKWNAEAELRKPVTIELWSDNFTKSASEGSFAPVKGTETVLTADNGWEVTFNNLPKYNTEHKKINYYVKESKVNGADFNVDNYAIYFYDQVSETDYSEVGERYKSNANIAPIPENAYKMYVVNTPKTSLKASKIWNDEDNRQGLRANVNVTLSNDDGIIVSPATKTFTIADNSSVTWNYLPMYKKPDVNFVKSIMAHMGKVNYTITEASTLIAKGYEIPEYTFNDKSSITDSGFTINLGKGNNNATITNTYHPHKISFMASKNWDDESNRHFSRPKGIYLTLYYSTDNATWNKVERISSDYVGKNYPNGSHVYTLSSVTQHVANNDSDTWRASTWEGLPTMVSKKAIYYKAFESDEYGNMKATPGYTATHSPESIDVSSKISGDTVSQNIVNKLEHTSMCVSKEWLDTYDVSDRPDSVSFVLEYRCGDMDSWRVYKNADGTVLKAELKGSDHKTGTTHIWEKKIENLPSINSEGRKYEYRVKEISISYGAEEIVSHGVTADGISQSIFTREGDSWKAESTVGTFGNTVVTSYSPASESSEYGYKVTAVNTPVVGKLTVVKEWDDECNRDNLRPHEIKLQLYRKQNQAAPVEYGEAVVVGPGREGTTVSPNNNVWSYTFNNLPVYNNDSLEHTDGNKSIYYVKEVNSDPGYAVNYTPESGDTTVNYDDADNILKHNSDGTYSTSEVITNKHTPVRIKIKVKKEWMENHQTEFRPDSVAFKLQYRIAGESGWKNVLHAASEAELDRTGTMVQTTSSLEQVLSGSKASDIWEDDNVFWDNLPAYVNNGKKVEYRLLEEDNDGTLREHYSVYSGQCEYETEYGLTYSLKATNVLLGEGGILEIDKRWTPDHKDDIAQGDKIIYKIKCHLEQRSTLSLVWDAPTWGNFELSHENNWQHIFAHDLTTTAVYRVVEDAIVYKNSVGEFSQVDAEGIGNRIGSFVWDVTPKEIKTDGDSKLMQATLTNTIPDNSITVSKTWADEHNRDGKRPHSVTVRLLRDGVPVGEPVILYPKDDKVDGPWEEYTWKNLPIYKNGTLEKSVYTVEEVTDEEFRKIYEISYKVDDGTNQADCENIEFNAAIPAKNVKVSITNKHETHKETIMASKIWEDENDKYKTRPKKLLGDYHTYFMLLYRLENQSNWERVTEYPDYADFEKRGYQYKDHHVYTTSPVIQEVTGNTGEKWENVAIWENVSTRGVDDVYSKETNPDQNVLFKVIEVPGLDYVFPGDDNSAINPISIAPTGYKASEPKTFDPEKEHVIVEYANITNTLITTSLEVEKTWEDQDNQFATRPEKIRVKLERKLKEDEADPNKSWNSVKQADKEDTIIEISASDNWKGLFDKLPLYNNDGKEFVYRAIETTLIYEGNEVALNVTDEADNGKKREAEGGNYVSKMENTSVTGDNPESVKYKLSLKNTLKDSDDDTTTLTVIKKWSDENNRDGIRPDYITVNLFRDGVKVDTKTVFAPSWQNKWDKLPLYKNGYSKGIFGKKSVYTVTEETIAEYDTVIEESDDNQYTITNTHVPKKAVITADKIWEDNKNTYSTRPKEIYLRLLYKYEGESDSEYRIVPVYADDEFERSGMYDSEGVFTTSASTQMCVGSGDENWSRVARWENLPLLASPNSDEYASKSIIYKVIEVPAPDTDNTVNTSIGVNGYEVLDASVEGNRLNTDGENNVKITNFLITTELSIEKIFEDEENKYNTRPDSIEVQVVRRIKSSGNDDEWKPVKVKGGMFEDDLFVTLTKAEAFTKKVTNLPKYDKDGNEYEYTCLEKTLIFGKKRISVDESNVTATYTTSGSETKITNTLITTSLTVAKVWDDESNKSGARPEKIVFVVERKETMNIASQIISELVELFTGKDGYSELKIQRNGKEETVEIVLEGPDFSAYTLDGLPVYSEEGNSYSYRAIETKFVYADREVMVENETSLYEKPMYQIEAIESLKDSKGNVVYKYNETVVNKIIPVKKKPVNPGPANPGPVDSDPVEPAPENPVPGNPGPVNPDPAIPASINPEPNFEIIEDGEPELLPERVIDTINELIDLPDNELRQEKLEKLYNDLIKILQEDPAFLDKLDPETADIIRTFLATGVLGRRRGLLPKTGGVVGSAMAVLFGIALIGLGFTIRPGDESEKKKKALK